MHTGKEIIITQVANGWLVITPLSPSQMAQYPSLMNDEEMLRHQARIMKEEFTGDELLRKIQQENEEHEPAPDNIKQDNLFIFSTFPEVLAFLKSRFEHH